MSRGEEGKKIKGKGVEKGNGRVKGGKGEDDEGIEGYKEGKGGKGKARREEARREKERESKGRSE